MRKKLIEVALPLEAINDEASLRKRKAPAGYPTTLHKWWAQRPLAAARAVIFAQMVDDPGSWPELFPTEKKQEKERQRLFKIIEDLVQWQNTTNEEVLERARVEIWESWRRACAENADHPRAKELFNRNKLPAFHDPFAGGGSLPLEAQRLGLQAYASDLNPVAVLINKAMIEIPPRFAGRPPVNPDARKSLRTDWRGAQGLAEDVRYYGKWMRDEAEKRIGHLYPKVEITAEMAKDRPDLQSLVGQKLTVIAWLWVRTVKSPNPAFKHVEVPLASTFALCTNDGRRAYVEPIINGAGYRFEVRIGDPEDLKQTAAGTKLTRGANFRCLLSGTPIVGEYIKTEGKAGRMGVRLMAIVAEHGRRRVYLDPDPEHEASTRVSPPTDLPDLAISGSTQYLGVKPYGMERFAQLFTNRQLVALSVLSDLVREARERVQRDALATRAPASKESGPEYEDAVALFLSFSISRVADYGSTIATWRPKDSAMRSSLAMQTIPMTWDFAEGSPFGKSSAGVAECAEVVAKVIENALPVVTVPGVAEQADAAKGARVCPSPPVISADPPYYDNVPYSDLSDYFYIWLRRALRPIFPGLFPTVAAPKTDELVAFAYRHKDKPTAEAFFLGGMTQAMHRLAELAHPGFPVTIYYAFKQSESDDNDTIASTGWETFLDAVIRAGFAITGTWPMRTEGDNRQRGVGANALASSIVSVCRPRAANAPTATRREFVAALKSDLPAALALLQKANIAPVDLAQAAIGPGMGVYTRFERVLDAEGKSVSVRDALALINQTLDEVLAQQEGDFDADTRWALAWFEQTGFESGEYGLAETLSKAKNTSIEGLVEAGILTSKGGKVRLLRPEQLAADWDPAKDPRLPAWEVVHRLIRALDTGGESAAAELVAKLGTKAEVARELAYRLYTICERKKRAAEALSYNALVQSWPEVTRLSREKGPPKPAQAEMFDRE